MRRNHCHGFAALSLVISLLIIALIASLAITYLAVQQGGGSVPGTSPVQRAKGVECLAQIRKLELQVQLYSVQSGSYPESLGMLEGLSESDVRCPVTHNYYLYDSQSGRVSCPDHAR